MWNETFFLWFFNDYSMIYVNVGDFKDSLKQDLELEFCRNQSKDFSILTETHINHDQIQRNNWLSPIFISPELVTQKDCLSCFIQILKVSLRLTLIQNGGLCPLRGLLPVTEFSVFIALYRIAWGDRWLGCVSLKDYKIIWKIKVREMKTE